MNTHPFFRLIELINFDQSVHQLESSLGHCKQQVREIEQQLVKLGHEALQAQQRAIEARKTVDRIELDMQGLDQQIRDKKRKMEQVANFRESQALQRELDQLHAQQQEFEDSLLKAWNSLESAEREQESFKTSDTHAQLALNQALEKKGQECGAIQHSLQAFEKERASKNEGIPAEWLEKYNAMRTIITNPVVAVEGDSCGACFHELLAQDISRLKRGALLECKGCFRFLYNKEIIASSGENAGDNVTDTEVAGKNSNNNNRASS